jgi:serine/threonine-protein kinase BUR1
MFKRKPILTGSSDLNQTQLIFELMGSPNDENMPGWDLLPMSGPVKKMDRMTGNIDRSFPGSVLSSCMTKCS